MKKLKCVAAVLCAGVLAASLCLAGCGDDETQRGPVTDEQGNVVVEVDKNISTTLVVAYKNENKELEMIKHLEALFQKEYPNVKFSNQAYTGSTSIVIDRNISAGEAPDIFMTNSFDMFSLDDKDLLLDFAPYMQREQELGTFDMGEYYETYFKLGQRDFNGAQLLVPRSVDRVVVHYNKEIIRRAEEETGQEIQKYIKNGWTWQDFETVCGLLKQYSAFRGTDSSPGNAVIDSSCNWEPVYNPIFKHFGVKYFDDNGKPAFDSEATKNALDMIKGWADKGYIGTTGDTADFMAGKGAMFMHSQSISRVAEELRIKAFPEVSEADFHNYYDAVTMPVFADTPYIGVGSAGYSAWAGTENPVLVWKFMKLMLSREGQNALADAGAQNVPIRRDMSDFTKEENHWGKGMENYNLRALTYNMGGVDEEGKPEPNWDCYTDYFIAPGYTRHAVALNDLFGQLVLSYARGTAYDQVIKSITSQVTATLRK